jgi:hypothetical protein
LGIRAVQDVDNITVEEVLPPPPAVVLGGERLHYSFRAHRPHERVIVVFRLRAERSGRLVGSVGMGDGAALTIRQLILP